MENLENKHITVNPELADYTLEQWEERLETLKKQNGDVHDIKEAILMVAILKNM